MDANGVKVIRWPKEKERASAPSRTGCCTA